VIHTPTPEDEDDPMHTPTNFIAFPVGGQKYAEWLSDATPVRLPADVKDLATLSGPEAVELYNLISSNIGAPSVKRFKDKANALRRLWQHLIAYKAVVEAEAVEPEPAAPAVASDFTEATPEELQRQTIRAQITNPAVTITPKEAVAAITPPVPEKLAAMREMLSDADRKQVLDEAASRPKPSTKREPRAGQIKTPRAPKPDDGALKLPTEGGKQRAKKQKDGSYTFRIPAGKPRTQKVSEERQELIDLFRGGEETWATIKAVLDKPNDFNTVTTITMFCITLGYGLLTNADGTISLLEPLA
jgi:hypothetical protein